MDILNISSDSEYDMDDDIASIQPNASNHEDREEEERNLRNQSIKNCLQLEMVMLKNGLNNFVGSFHHKGKYSTVFMNYIMK